MSEIGDAIQEKCMSFADRIIKLNDYLLDQAANKMYDGGRKKYDGKSRQTSNIIHLTFPCICNPYQTYAISC